ncbi:MAG: CotH kinase family protein [Bacteroidota bacterium]
MRLVICLLVAAGLASATASTQAQSVDFESSNLPIVLIDTGGDTILDRTRIVAQMSIIDNGEGERNAVTDTPNDYQGRIEIEIRGSSSQIYPKKQYRLETQDASGENDNVSLLGMPEENDWILHAPYGDKTLMHNVLAYGLARQMGRYASRTRFVEVVLNGQYEGVYVLMEKIKRDGDRVDISRLRPDEIEGDDLTGGYIFKSDRPSGDAEVEGWVSPYPSPASDDIPTMYLLDEPDPRDVAPEQLDYIAGVMSAFERVMASGDPDDPDAGYRAYIDLDSFVDFYIVTEVARNADGYRLSTFYHKDKDSDDPLIHAGPIWDFNASFGNANFSSASRVEGYQVDFSDATTPYPVPFWWRRLVDRPSFQEALDARWRELREGPLHTDSLMAQIDANAARLGEAQARNFERWPILGQYVWPNAFVGATYQEEIDYMKDWLTQRLAWLERRVTSAGETETPGALALGAPRPNPATGAVRLALSVGGIADVTVAVFDVRGRQVQTVWAGAVSGRSEIDIDVSGLSAGVYLVRATSPAGSATQTLAVVR